MTGAGEAATPREAVVLVGGLGTRLAPVLAGRPKALAPVNGRPFIAHLLEWLARSGVERVVLCVGHLAEPIEAALGARHGALELAYAREAAPLGTAGAIAHGAGATSADPVLALNGDSFVELDLHAMARTHARHPGRPTIAVVEVPDSARFGTVRIDAAGRLESFVEKTGAAAPGWINAGVYLLPRARIASWPPRRPLSFERDTLPAALPDGVWAHRCAPGARFLDIGTPPDLERAAGLFERGTP
jgi:D-glycero-alpha-D-manno-heptose 1-phosphate guanylyltransferase